MPRLSNRPWTLALLACLWLAGPLLAQDEPAPVPREVLQARLHRFANSNAERRNNLQALFEEAGCGDDRLSDQPVKRSLLPNVICTLPGATDSVILVGAHFDFRGAGQGAADNWSGAALLPSLFQGLRDRPRRHTFVFVSFTDEEKGLRGSKEYAKRLKPADRARVRAMVNLDTLGLSASKVWSSRADPELAALLFRVAHSLNLPLERFNFERLGASDSESFRKRKIPSITIHSLTRENHPILHSSRDQVGAIQPDSYYDTYRLVAAYLARLDAERE